MRGVIFPQVVADGRPAIEASRHGYVLFSPYYQSFKDFFHRDNPLEPSHLSLVNLLDPSSIRSHGLIIDNLRAVSFDFSSSPLSLANNIFPQSANRWVVTISMDELYPVQTPWLPGRANQNLGVRSRQLAG